MSNESTNPDLSITTRVDWLAGFVRADRIRLDTLVQLAAALGDDTTRDDVLAALEDLTALVKTAHPAGPALDAAVEAVEDAAGMDLAQVPIDAKTAVRLSNELATVTERLTRFASGRTTRIPGQQDQYRRRTA